VSPSVGSLPMSKPIDVRSHRVGILDQLRAYAIIFVIIYHVVQMSPVQLPWIAHITHYGQHGVDLFFVLSGWLIGGLYWREMKAFNGVGLLRFWVRRWMRTLPPYFAALILSWLAVFWTRAEPFDWGYLVFLQNYYQRIPFFLVSWSLCIEEHFYLVAPIAAGLVMIFMPRKNLWLLWVVLIAVSPYFRWLEWLPAPTDDFGYRVTASHLRLDGLVVGFGLSYISIFAPLRFNQLSGWCLVIIPTCIVGLVALDWVGGLLRSVFWASTIAALCGAVVVVGVSRNHSIGKTGVIPWKTLAITSYSAYLVHPLAIHIARNAVSVIPPPYWMLYWPAVIALCLLATASFYVSFEKPSIVLRDMWVPSRSASDRTANELQGGSGQRATL
jgi:peptidoglycan/LPS O-acetylase OafA/YrhL